MFCLSIGRAITLSIDAKDNRPKAYIELKAAGATKPVQCVLERIFVSSTDRWVGPPKVDYVEICGFSVADGTAISEKVIP